MWGRWFPGALLLALAPAARADFDVGVFAGVVAFPGEAAADAGGTWGVSAGFEAIRPLGVELGYQGAAYTEERDADRTVSALENGFYGLGTWSPLRGDLQPYALGGFALSWLNAVDATEGGALQDDLLMRIPVGLGLDLDLGAFRLGARGIWGFLFGNEEALDTRHPRGADQLFATLHLGAAF